MKVFERTVFYFLELEGVITIIEIANFIYFNIYKELIFMILGD